MPKLIIQIPCLNEEASLSTTISKLPKHIDGIDNIEYLVIDDCSSDDTVKVAHAAGAHHILSLSRHQGLAQAFALGLGYSLRLGADIIVNTDADDQYCADDIQLLVRPILEGRAEMVIGTRPIKGNREFSLIKRLLQAIGSKIVSRLSRTKIPDAASGFRAFSRDAAMRLNVFSHYSYTMETLIQAGLKDMSIVSIPIRTNPATRPSRLFRSIGQYVFRSGLTIARIFIVYRPLLFFSWAAAVCAAVGIGLGARFLYYYFLFENSGHIQSLVVAVGMLGMATVLMISGIITDLIGVNRQLLEKIDYRQQIRQSAPTDDRKPVAIRKVGT